jgi:hypothetical protein
LCEPAPGSKSLLVLFFRKEQDSSFSEEKEAKRLLLSRVVLGDPGLGRIATPYPRGVPASWHALCNNLYEIGV